MSKRRGHGEGSWFKRTINGTEMWVRVITLPNGKKKTFYGSGKNAKEKARHKELEFLKALEGGVVESRNITMDKHLTSWLDSAQGRLRPKTYARYKQIVDDYLIPDLGYIPLLKLQPQHVQNLLNKQKDLKPASISYIRAVLRSSLSQAVKWGMVTRNVAALVDVPTIMREQTNVLNIEQARRFLSAAEGKQFKALFTVTLSTGLRLGEALGLTWDNVDLENGVIRVRQAIQRLDGAFHVVDVKTVKGQRDILLFPEVLEELRRHKEIVDLLRTRKRWQENNLVFPSSVGTPIWERNIRRELRQIELEANLPHIRFHDLRHSCATILLAMGIPARTIMEILGHSNISTTMNIYSHVLDSMKQDAANAMRSALCVSLDVKEKRAPEDETPEPA